MRANIPAALLAHYALSATTIAWGLKITRTDGEIFGFTSYHKSVEISGVTYSATPGVQVSSLANSAGLQVGNLEITTLDDGEVFTKQDVFSNVWMNAAFELFRFNHQSTSDGRDVRLVGTLGEFKSKQSSWVIELRDLRQYLQAMVGEPSTKTCRYRLGDERCGVVLTGSPNLWTVTGLVTSVIDKQAFRDSNRSERDNWFTGGILTWLSGANAGLSMPVKSYASGSPNTQKEFVLFRAMIGQVQVGDAYRVHAGCDHTIDGDDGCNAKFDNALNFGGEPHRPTMDQLTAPPTTDV